MHQRPNVEHSCYDLGDLNQVWQRWTHANCAHLEKLATAAASVSQTSNTVSSLLICSTSLNLLPRWQRSNDAPWVFALQCAATRMPSPRCRYMLVVYVQDDFLLSFGGQTLQFLT